MPPDLPPPLPPPAWNASAKDKEEWWERYRERQAVVNERARVLKVIQKRQKSLSKAARVPKAKGGEGKLTQAAAHCTARSRIKHLPPWEAWLHQPADMSESYREEAWWDEMAGAATRDCQSREGAFWL